MWNALHGLRILPAARRPHAVCNRMSGPLLAGGGKCNEEVPAVGALGVFLRAASQELQYLA